jgi:hypothetical protein
MNLNNLKRPSIIPEIQSLVTAPSCPDAVLIVSISLQKIKNQAVAPAKKWIKKTKKPAHPTSGATPALTFFNFPFSAFNSLNQLNKPNQLNQLLSLQFSALLPHLSRFVYCTFFEHSILRFLNLSS